MIIHLKRRNLLTLDRLVKLTLANFTKLQTTTKVWHHLNMLTLEIFEHNSLTILTL
jgi:hypothetical protein